MAKILKKRDLLSRSDGSREYSEDNISVSDFAVVLGLLSGEASTLELQDNFQAAKRSRELTFQLEKMCKMYRQRMNAVRDEIRIDRRSNPKVKAHNANKIIEINNSKSNH